MQIFTLRLFVLQHKNNGPNALLSYTPSTLNQYQFLVILFWLNLFLHLSHGRWLPSMTSKFQAHIKFPSDYPYNPPSLRFQSKVWHPNVYENGDLCISILHPPVDDPQSGELPCERWNPTQNVRTILLSVVSLLNEPNTFRWVARESWWRDIISIGSRAFIRCSMGNWVRIIFHFTLSLCSPANVDASVMYRRFKESKGKDKEYENIIR